MDKPVQLYNMDETGMPLDLGAPNIIAGLRFAMNFCKRIHIEL